jgi:thiamine kinase-like enzyme
LESDMKKKRQECPKQRPFNHPAIQAWLTIENPGLIMVPDRVEVIQEEKVRSVYRLYQSTNPSLILIAKHAPKADAACEELVYSKYLQRFPFPNLQFYGVADTGDEYSSWLFMEEITGQTYKPDIPEHRRLAGEWLGILHTRGAQFLDGMVLPDKGPSYYFPQIEIGVSLIQTNLSNPALNRDGLSVLQRTLEQCAQLMQHLPALKSFCTGIPSTIVHGDFKEDNLLVTTREAVTWLQPFDYGFSGWGPPSLDLAKFLSYSVAPDLDAYLTIVRKDWPYMDEDMVYRIGYIGEIFRWADSIRWIAEGLRYKWLDGTIDTMRIYVRWMDEILNAAPWKDDQSTRKIRSKPLPKEWH